MEVRSEAVVDLQEKKSRKGRGKEERGESFIEKKASGRPGSNPKKSATSRAANTRPTNHNSGLEWIGLDWIGTRTSIGIGLALAVAASNWTGTSQQSGTFCAGGSYFLLFSPSLTFLQRPVAADQQYGTGVRRVGLRYPETSRGGSQVVSKVFWASAIRSVGVY